MSEIELVCFDMAGTTMIDNGLVLEAFHRTIDEMGVGGDEAEAAERYVLDTMGQSKIEVFTALFASRAPIANEAFESHFLDAAQELGVSEIPGATSTVRTLQGFGLRVALTTGFSPVTREALIDLLGWSDLFEVRVSPADAGRGRPAPDMLLTCALRSRVTATSSLMAVGDTASDMMAGRRAGAGSCVGVLSGTDDEHRLLASGADEVITSVVDLLSFDSLTLR
jgi:phosphoglycolate phosphatase